MSDDERMAALFRAAAADAPPPRFDHDDVVHASRRITARRRAAAVAAAVVVGLAGAGAAITLPGMVGSDGDLTSAAAPAEPFSVPEAADAREDRAGSGAETSGGADTAPAPAAPPPAPLGAGQDGCADRQDPAVRALVEQVLPEVVGAPPAATTDICLPGDQRHLALEVDDGRARGVLTVASLPAGAVVDVPPGGVSAPTASGGTVVVGSTADAAGGPAPFADRLPALLEHLAPRL